MKNIRVGLRVKTLVLLVLVVFRPHLVTSSKMILFGWTNSVLISIKWTSSSSVHVSVNRRSVYISLLCTLHGTQDLESHFLTPLGQWWYSPRQLHRVSVISWRLILFICCFVFFVWCTHLMFSKTEERAPTTMSASLFLILRHSSYFSPTLNPLWSTATRFQSETLNRSTIWGVTIWTTSSSALSFFNHSNPL